MFYIKNYDTIQLLAAFWGVTLMYSVAHTFLYPWGLQKTIDATEERNKYII